MPHFSRRRLLGAMTMAALAAPMVARGAAPKVVVVGGGFGGATAAQQLRLQDPGLEIVLVERAGRHVTCPFSNLVLGGLETMPALVRGFDALAARRGVSVVQGEAIGVDAMRRELALADGSRLAFDRLVLAPGIDLDYAGLEGYSAEAAEIMPHAWQAGPQTELLGAQLEAMQDGGTVIIVAPDNPFRCPPGPYERACMIGHYLKTTKPRSKLLILDAKTKFSKQALFMQAFETVYAGMIEWRASDAGGRVIRVDPKAMTVETEFGEEAGDVVNVIPPQRAGAVARAAGVADATGWCAIDPVSFESRLVPGIHVIGDACIAAPMPKSATAANSHAKVAAAAIVALLRGQDPGEPALNSTCYSLAAPDHAFSVTGVYIAGAKGIEEVAGGVSPLDASAEDRALEAAYARDWYRGVCHEAWG